MLDQKDLEAIALLIKNEVEPFKNEMNEKFDKVDARLSKLEKNVTSMKKDIKTIKEDTEITREVTNSIGEWVDFYFHDDKPYPLDDESIENQNKALRLIND